MLISIIESCMKSLRRGHICVEGLQPTCRTEYKLMSPENLNVPITGMHSYEEEEEEEDAMEGDVPGDNEVDEGSLIISEDPDNESTV